MATANKPKVLIVSPYFAHLGGGERYILSAAAAIERAGYQLFFAWDQLAQINKLSKLLGLKLKDPQLDRRILASYSSHNPLAMWRATRRYALVLYLSDGSIPLLGGKKNLLHFQVPFHGVNGRSFLNQLKLTFINKVIVNSRFTKQWIDHEFALDSTVIYPPIQPIKAGEKQKLILSVGRFEPSLNVKRQDILIKAFRQLSPQLPGWSLILAGASNNKTWLTKLRQSAKGFPIDFYPNLTYRALTKLYAKAAIYWHAAGYQVDEKLHPELVEHFGITTAEALTAGCIPLVVPKGGQTEVVPDSQYHWQNPHTLITLTRRAISQRLAPPSIPPSLTQPSFATLITRVINS